jgi:adenylate kinase
MEDGIHYRVVILLGAPGAGKDTQADYLVREMDMVQVPSSQIIFKKFEEHPDDPVVQEQIARVKAGFLNDATLTGKWIMEFVRAELPKGRPLVFSGSPRTVEEGKVELAELDELVGLQHVVAFDLTLDENVARERIKKRRFCRANKHSIPGSPEFQHIGKCPLDGSELYVRDLDANDLQDQRWEEYYTKTVPTIGLVRASGVPFFRVDASQAILAIHHEIADALERGRAPAPIS